MIGEATTRQSTADRVELILQELESLPTLSRVAVRLLELTADEDADAGEVCELVTSDPALASKVLALCRCHERGRASNVSTVERAVLLLGFEAVRCAVLSVQVFELVDGLASPVGEVRNGRPVFDREAFWLHALGTAVASEELAARGTHTQDTRPGEAYMAGLLHDLGQLALHVLLPETFDQVCRMAETHAASLDRVCRQIVGIDTHTAGKRLAERWGLPRSLVDVIWLSGQAPEALPPVPHRALISVVSLADALVRTRYITPGAQGRREEGLAALCVPVGVTPDDAEAVADTLHERVAARATALGLSDPHDPSVLLRAISRANESLARANAGMRQRERLAQRQARALRAVAEFHRTLPEATTVSEVLGCIAVSAAVVLGAPVSAALTAGGEGRWRLHRFAADGRPFGSRVLEPPPDAVPFDSIVHDIRAAAPAGTLVPWLADPLNLEDLDGVALFPLEVGPGGGAILLLHGGAEPLETGEDVTTAALCWCSALASGTAHDRAAALAEELAAANRTIIDTQEALARSRTMGTLGEVAAGAAHEMNNPLTVIAGRAQLLAGHLQDPAHKRMAVDLVAQSHRLSDMITALRSFAEPVQPRRRPIDLAELILRVVQKHGPGERRQPQLNTVLTEPIPPVLADPELLGGAIGELVSNAVESKGARHIELRVQTDPRDDRLKIEVRDDGEGMSDHTLRHAFDPFYSARPAGRQPGLGLARARRFIEAHGGRIDLVNGPSGGAIATIRLADWRAGSFGAAMTAPEPPDAGQGADR